MFTLFSPLHLQYISSRFVSSTTSLLPLLLFFPHLTSSISLTQQPQIILMKEGTDSSQGTPQLISNINACAAVVDAVRTTLGPRGMDKLIVDAKVKAC